MCMSLLLLLAAVAADHRVVFTRYETRAPSEAQNEAYKSGDKQKLAKLLPVIDRVELRLRNGETERFTGRQLDGFASLEVDSMGYLLTFDTGLFHHKSQMLLQKCRPKVFYSVSSRVGGKSKIVAESVSVGSDC